MKGEETHCEWFLVGGSYRDGKCDLEADSFESLILFFFVDSDLLDMSSPVLHLFLDECYYLVFLLFRFQPECVKFILIGMS